jgi:hypothetical protein
VCSGITEDGENKTCPDVSLRDELQANLPKREAKSRTIVRLLADDF